MASAGRSLRQLRERGEAERVVLAAAILGLILAGVWAVRAFGG